MMPGTDASVTYADLLAHMQPRSIANAADADHVQGLIDALLDQPVRTTAEEDLLSLLGDVLEAWESKRYDLAAPSPAEAIRTLLDAHGLEQRHLVGPVFATKSIASEVLSGKRHLTYAHVERLAALFHVSPSVFYS